MNRADQRIDPSPSPCRNKSGAMPFALHFRLGNRIHQQQIRPRPNLAAVDPTLEDGQMVR